MEDRLTEDWAGMELLIEGRRGGTTFWLHYTAKKVQRRKLAGENRRVLTD
jgi:hypothetical protein